MPKKKKQPRNAYYFFIVEKKKEYERAGTRFRSIQDVFAMENLRNEWKNLDANKKSRFEQLAKEAKAADKEDLTNKFTCSGESYAQVNQRLAQERSEEEFKEELLSSMTMEGEGLNSRAYVVFKGTYVVEVGYPPDSEFLPVELALAAFNLERGYLSNHSTLVDTGEIPLGYAAQAKETFDETALPLPGSHKFKPGHRDYLKILGNIKRFVQTFATPVNGYYVIFIRPDDAKPVDEGILQWLVKKVRKSRPDPEMSEEAKRELEEAKKELYDFFDSLKFIRVTKLLLKLGGVARVRCPSFNSHIALFGNLEHAAQHILSSSDFDYTASITCAYHNLSTEDNESMKMNRCCRNIVLRTIFIILRELIPSMLVQPQTTHLVNCIKAPPEYRILPNNSQVLPKRDINQVEEDSELANNNWDGTGEPTSREFKTTPHRDTSSLGTARMGVVDWNSGVRVVDNSWGMAAGSTPSFSSDDFPVLGGGESATGTGRRESSRVGSSRGRGYTVQNETDDGWMYNANANSPANIFERNQKVEPEQESWSSDPPGGSRPGSRIGFGRGRGRSHYQN